MATPHNCIFDALRKFCAQILLRFLAIHQVLLRNRAASGRKIYTQIILAELCGIALYNLLKTKLLEYAEKEGGQNKEPCGNGYSPMCQRFQIWTDALTD